MQRVMIVGIIGQEIGLAVHVNGRYGSEVATMNGYDDEAVRVGGLRVGPFWQSWRGRLLLLAIVAASASVPWLIKVAMGG